MNADPQTPAAQAVLYPPELLSTPRAPRTLSIVGSPGAIARGTPPSVENLLRAPKCLSRRSLDVGLLGRIEKINIQWDKQPKNKSDEKQTTTTMTSTLKRNSSGGMCTTEASPVKRRRSGEIH